MTDAGCRASGSLGRPSRLGRQCRRFFILAGGAFAVQLRCPRTGGELGDGHAHYVVSNAVCLMLKRVIDLSDCKLRLPKRRGGFWSAWAFGRKRRNAAETTSKPTRHEVRWFGSTGRSGFRLWDLE